MTTYTIRVSEIWKIILECVASRKKYISMHRLKTRFNREHTIFIHT